MKSKAGGFQARGRGGEVKRAWSRIRLQEDDAMTVEGVALLGPVRVVVARIAIANAQNTATAAALESHAIVGVRDNPVFSVQDGNRNHYGVLAICMKDLSFG